MLRTCECYQFCPRVTMFFYKHTNTMPYNKNLPISTVRSLWENIKPRSRFTKLAIIRSERRRHNERTLACEANFKIVFSDKTLTSFSCTKE